MKAVQYTSATAEMYVCSLIADRRAGSTLRSTTYPPNIARNCSSLAFGRCGDQRPTWRHWLKSVESSRVMRAPMFRL